MNHMKEIAKMLGVVFYERFKIKEVDNENFRFYLDAAGLNWENDDVKDMDDETLVCLITGKYHIEKLQCEEETATVQENPECIHITVNTGTRGQIVLNIK